MHPLVLWSRHRPPAREHRSVGAELLHSHGRAAGRQVCGVIVSSAALRASLGSLLWAGHVSGF